MAWFELDPDPQNDTIAETHLDAGFDTTLQVNWKLEQELVDKLSEAGISSDDEFVKRSNTQQIVAPIVGQLSIQQTNLADNS